MVHVSFIKLSSVVTFVRQPLPYPILSPATGTLKSKFVPDENKSDILSLFGIPMNMLAAATGCMAKLTSIAKKEAA